MSVSILPTINASLNALSAIFLLTGYVLIRNKRIEAHRKAMLAACTSSTLFLISYLVYHAQAGATRFTESGIVRVIYFAILLSHTLLAVAVVPLAVASLFNGLKMRVEKHRRVARWAFPIWMYVSVTGVVVYLFLYHWFPPRS